MKTDSEQNIKNCLNQFGWLGGDRKKIILAAGLIMVMFLMWGKVLLRKKDGSASVELMLAASQNMNLQQDRGRKISYIKLPLIEGRNDVLKTDFFNPGEWEGFELVDKTEDWSKQSNVTVKGAGSNDFKKENIYRVAKKLQLEAIVMGENPEAFISDKLVSTGDVLKIRHNAGIYEFRVTKIGKSKVELICEDMIFTMQMAQSIESAD